MRIQIAFGHVAVAQHLKKQVGVYVLGLLGDHHLGCHRLRRDHETDPHTGGEYLGEGGRVNDQPLGVHALDGGNIPTGEAQFPIGVILQDHDAVLLCQFIYSHPLFV